MYLCMYILLFFIYSANFANASIQNFQEILIVRNKNIFILVFSLWLLGKYLNKMKQPSTSAKKKVLDKRHFYILMKPPMWNQSRHGSFLSKNYK